MVRRRRIRRPIPRTRFPPFSSSAAPSSGAGVNRLLLVRVRCKALTTRREEGLLQQRDLLGGAFELLVIRARSSPAADSRAVAARESSAGSRPGSREDRNLRAPCPIKPGRSRKCFKDPEIFQKKETADRQALAVSRRHRLRRRTLVSSIPSRIRARSLTRISMPRDVEDEIAVACLANRAGVSNVPASSLR